MKTCEACKTYDRTGIWGSGHIDHFAADCEAQRLVQLAAVRTQTTGTIVVIERYRDGNQWREHYGCDSCGQRVHWTRANLGDQHDCTAVQS